MTLDFKGFSLIEAVVAISALGILGIFLTNSLISNLRDQARVRISNQIKQNGQLVLDTLGRQIREADGIVFCDPGMIIVDKGGFLTRYRYIPPLPNSNGHIAYDNPPNAKSVGNQVSDDPCTNTIFGLESLTYLTDIDRTKGVSIDTDIDCDNVIIPCGIFIKSAKPGFQDALTIKFKVKAPIDSSAALENLMEPVHFATTVQIRKL